MVQNNSWHGRVGFKRSSVLWVNTHEGRVATFAMMLSSNGVAFIEWIVVSDERSLRLANIDPHIFGMHLRHKQV